MIFSSGCLRGPWVQGCERTIPITGITNDHIMRKSLHTPRGGSLSPVTLSVGLINQRTKALPWASTQCSGFQRSFGEHPFLMFSLAGRRSHLEILRRRLLSGFRGLNPERGVFSEEITSYKKKKKSLPRLIRGQFYKQFNWLVGVGEKGEEGFVRGTHYGWVFGLNCLSLVFMEWKIHRPTNINL